MNNKASNIYFIIILFNACFFLLHIGKVDGMWSMWHIYHAWNNKLWTLYPNLPDSRGLTISWREAGLHYKGGNSAKDPLLQEWEPAYEDLPATPAKLDVNGKVISVKIR